MSDGTRRTMRMNGLSVLLWRERELLQALVVRLEQERRSLDKAPTRWPARSTAAVDGLLEELRLVELARAAAADGVARELGAGAGANLSGLVALAPPPWDARLAEHREALVGLAKEVARVAGTNHRALAQLHSLALDVLAGLQARTLTEATG